MSQFAQDGSASAEDGDRGFVSINQRLQLNQLQAGEVRESLNGRMEGYWKPRKNVVSRTGALTNGQAPLQLPFLLTGTSVLITAASVTSGVVTLTTGSAHGLSAGATLNISKIGYANGSDPNGVFTALTASGTTITYALAGGIGPYIVSASSPISEVITSTSKPIASVSLASSVVTITITAGHEFIAGTIGYGLISGLGFTGADPNGMRALTYASATTMTFPVTSATTAVSGTGTLSQVPINDSASANVRASCLFSDPNDSNKEYAIIALDTVAKKVDLDGYSITDITYPNGEALGEDTDMIQVFDKVMLFRDGKQALEWYPHGRPILSASQSGSTTVTMRVTEHGLPIGTPIIISGLTGGTPANGSFTVASVIDQDTFTYVFTTSQTQVFGIDLATVSSGFTLSPGGSYTQPQVFVSDGLNVSSLDGLVTANIAGNLTISKGDVVSIYESTIPEFTTLVGKQFIVTSSSLSQIQFYAQVQNFTRDIVSASQIGTTVTANVKGHDFAASDSITIAGLSGVNGGTIPNGSQTVTSINGDSFTYTATAALAYYTIPSPLNATAASWASGGVITITITGHGLGASGWANIVFTGADSALNGNYLFTKVDANKLSFTVPSSTSVTYQTPVLSQMKYDFIVSGATAKKPTRSSQQIKIGGEVSVGGGFMHQPGAPWGVHFQRRLWIPYYYDQSGAYNNVAYTSRKITDEIAVSDILDTTTFDQIENQFRISGGTADYVVAMHGFYDDGLVVLNRNSLHLVKGTQGSLLDVVVKELTSEVGCLARKSVVMRGNAMLFLSDDGVYGIEFLNDYNLRGTEEPLSKSIQPYIDRINIDYANKAIGVLFKNRYYLAVPLDSVRGAGDAYGNNAILIYNFLNNGWESLDTFGDSRFLIKDFVIGSANERNNIYVVTANGGLHQIEASESSNDILNVDNSNNVVSPSINSSLTSRGYDLKTLDRKRFTDAQINIQSLVGQNAEYDIAFAAEDPDNSESIGTTSDFLGGLLIPTTTDEAETASIRCRLGGIRGFTGTMILTRTVGSPKINSIKVTGSITNRQIISQK